MMDKLRIAFLGTGSMGSAVLEGLLAAGHPKELISATTKSETSAQKLRSMGISAMSVETAEDANALMAGDADLIVLGVKPYQIRDLLGELEGEIGKNAVLISMAAGIELSTMSEVLPLNPNLIRTMPNTPSLVGKGVTGIAAAASASKEALAATVALFEKVGASIVVEESQINVLSAISGSGPAWVYYFIEQWEKIAQQHGFNQADAKVLVRGTFDGALTLLSESSEEPEVLRARVTSPNGTTQALIESLEKSDLNSVFARSLAAAVARAEEIAKS
jgi:pyrroline-5-carboxylate reductase